MRKMYIVTTNTKVGEGMFNETQLKGWVSFYLEKGINFQVTEINEDFVKKVEALKTRCENIKKNTLNKVKDALLYMVTDKMEEFDISDDDISVEYNYFGMGTIKDVSIMIEVGKQRLKLSFQPNNHKVQMTNMAMCTYNSDNTDMVLLDILKYHIWSCENYVTELLNDIWDNVESFKECEDFSSYLNTYNAMVEKLENKKEGK